jgi:hypothetical protein
MDAAQHQTPSALVVADSDQQRCKRPRSLLDARTAWTDKQICVHRPFGGAAQRPERTILADDSREHALTLRKDWLDCFPDARCDFRGRALRVDDDPPVLLRQIAIRSTDLRVELRTRSLEPITLGRDPLLGDVVGQIQHDDDVGDDIL